MSSDTCIKFLKGRCNFGDRCKEQHPANNSGWATSTPAFNAGYGLGAMGMGGFDVGLGGMGMGGMPMQQVGMPQAMLGMGNGMPFAPFGFMPNFGVPDDGGGRGKRTREGENGAANWKKQQPNMDALNYFQATGGGRVHPCIRIYGTCKNGPACKYAMMPIGACLQNFKGACKFGDKCREQHIQVPGQDMRGSKGPGTRHPCERIYGFCQDGEQCRFAQYPADYCLMFLKGRCRFGDSCREVHARDVDTVESVAAE